MFNKVKRVLKDKIVLKKALYLHKIGFKNNVINAVQLF